MTIIQLPRFSSTAAKFWAEIPASVKKNLLDNVYCSQCRGSVKVVNIAGIVKGGDLVLTGSCAVCGSGVARVIEGSN